MASKRRTTHTANRGRAPIIDADDLSSAHRDDVRRLRAWLHRKGATRPCDGADLDCSTFIATLRHREKGPAHG